MFIVVRLIQHNDHSPHLYLHIYITDNRHKISTILHAGCGSGKYLSCNPSVFSLGVDRCRALTELAREKDNEVGNTLSITDIHS